jgi:dihydrofolate reductase
LNEARSCDSAVESPEFSVIVAADQLGGIGRNGDLPWHLPGDLSYFRQLTTGQGANAVIMGRKTWESIPARFRPLKNRLNVVLSRSKPDLPAEVWLADSLAGALRRLAAGETEPALEHIFVIGGGTVYLEALQHPSCSRVFLTRVEGTFDCDTFLPDLEPLWHEVPHPCRFGLAPETAPDPSVHYRFSCLERQTSAH